MRWVMLSILIACAAYTHWRGKVRHGFFRQLSDHSESRWRSFGATEPRRR